MGIYTQSSLTRLESVVKVLLKLCSVLLGQHLGQTKNNRKRPSLEWAFEKEQTCLVAHLLGQNMQGNGLMRLWNLQ